MPPHGDEPRVRRSEARRGRIGAARQPMLGLHGKSSRMRAVKLVIDFRRGKELGRRMQRHAHHDLVERLVLHAGALAETFATDAARVRPDEIAEEAGRRIVEVGQAIGLLAEAASALVKRDS